VQYYVFYHKFALVTCLLRLLNLLIYWRKFHYVYNFMFHEHLVFYAFDHRSRSRSHRLVGLINISGL